MRVCLAIPQNTPQRAIETVCDRLKTEGNHILNPDGKGLYALIWEADVVYIFRTKGWEKELARELGIARDNNKVVIFEEVRD